MVQTKKISNKKTVFLLALFTFISVSLIFISSNIALSYIKDCLRPKTLTQVSNCLSSLAHLQKPLNILNNYYPTDTINQTLKFVSEIQKINPYKNYILGINEPTTYIILLQNDNEARANGGFPGSYIKTTLSALSNQPPNFSFHDIYTPDGQIQGHVTPPTPIQTAFRQGWFRLRDADWEPDFPSSAKTIRWFLAKGGETNPDMLITLNLSTIKKILNITGPIRLPEYNLILTPNNIDTTLQNIIQTNFFPGSTQKKDLLASSGKKLLQQLSHLKPKQYLEITNILITDLKRGNILINSTNPQLQKFIQRNNYAGQLTPLSCQTPNCLSDSLSIVETNLGSNKANCCVTRQTIHKITKQTDSITHQITINYTNTAPSENPTPPNNFGGNYINYIRFYIPKTATKINITSSPTLPQELDYYPSPLQANKPITPQTLSKYGFQELGFFHITKAGTTSTLTLSYKLPLNKNSSYQLSILKQHGFFSSPQTINIFGKTIKTELTNDFQLTNPL